MLSFNEFLIEAAKKTTPVVNNNAAANYRNTAMASAFESGVVTHLHDNSGARFNTSAKYIRHIKNVRKKHKDNMTKLPPEQRKVVRKRIRAAGGAFLKSAEDQGVHPILFKRIHHTPHGISKIVRREVDRSQNPHDLVVRHSNNKVGHGWLGASLKATAGTASNTLVTSFDKQSTIGTKVTRVWNRYMKMAGLERAIPTGAKNRAERRAIQARPEVIENYKKAQNASAKHHAKSFGKAKLRNKKLHLLTLLKLRPDVDYDYTKGDKGGSSTPYRSLEHYGTILNAKNITTEVRNSNVWFFDHEGRHIACAAHRSTHGPFSSNQVNGTFGTLNDTRRK